MDRRILKSISLVLSANFFLFLIISCSGMKNYLSWTKFLKTGEKQGRLAEKSGAQHAPAVGSRRGNPDSHYLLACYYLERERHKEALEEFKKVLSIDPGYVKAYNGMGVSYDMVGDFPRAIESYQNALNLNPNLDYILNNLAFSYILQENPDKAITVFKKAIALNDRDGRFHNNLGLAYAMKGNLDRALAEFKMAGDEAKAHYNLAQFLYKKESYDLAKIHYTAALNLDPSLTHVHTAIQATTALSSIFQDDTKKTSVPSAPPREEGVTGPSSERSVAKNPEESTAGPPDRGDRTDQAAIKTATLDKIPVLPAQEPKPKETTTLPSEGGVAGSYELQIASFHSVEKAASARTIFRASGYRTVIREWEDERRDKWYRLFIGPYETRDEASTAKEEIEKKHSLVPMIVQPSVTTAKSEEVTSRDQRPEKGSPSFLKGALIEISNGNGVNRMARNVGYYLREKGAKVIRFTNADHFNHGDTKIFYQKECSEAADYVAGQLPVARNMEETKRLDWPSLKIKVVIGKDLVQYKTVFEGPGKDLRADNRP